MTQDVTPAAEPRRILFFLHSLGYLRFFDPVIRLLLDRGHSVHLLIERENHEPNEATWLEQMLQRPGFSTSVARALYEDRWRGVATRLRRASDYLRFSGPEFRDAPFLVARARGRAPAGLVRLLESRPLRGEAVRRVLLRVLRVLERTVPSSPLVERELARHEPDVFVVAPHLMPGGRHSEYVKSAHAVGLSTCVCIASWDNLSSKQLLREIPDAVVVWNETQVREAVEIHGVPRERVVVTGAQSFDLWFDWPPRPREAFAHRVGLDPAKPYVLYLGGSLFPGELTEAEWVRDRWLPALRAHPTLGAAGVLVRPHPSRMPEWEAVALQDAHDVAVWPLGGNEMPVDDAARADFFDSVHHSAAVVGLNTSAMIETAIVGRPVLMLLVPEFHDSQFGTFHFDYLLSVAGGLPVLARSLDEHLGQLAETLAGNDHGAAERNRRFVSEFVRPHGLDRPATPLVVDAIERVAAAGHATGVRRDWPLLPLRGLLETYIYGKRAWWKLRHVALGRNASVQRSR